ncbi:TPA: DNA mismatch repair endonuclease MutL [Candidatus Marinimicrobia bacterium]|nr:MAG: Putative DNA mismatch repair protein, C-terminal domain protein [Marinimicrobia bacterium 46_47]KUK93370.1 MAG: Putative DNA mismatch repair protein, C-terminal domain protein [Marinimicrobia bacterium 46_43]HAE86543.1 DNA mismatch repair endonuclease MutL [Candidatus Neomarinimicrobiota bacterium]
MENPVPVIQIMSESLSNRIAAGEVVQRPASVVKELIENSLDAKATDIVIQIEEGGRELIRVVDNGVGMDRDDLLLAFEQHATSKLFDIADLAAIKTLGFRGEALASIASVSRIDARTCNNDMGEGFRLLINGGKVDRLEGAAMKQGTSITVRNLFFNTPARKKFLKSANAEYRHIVEIVRRFALARPNIRFHLTANDKDVYILPPEDLSSRLNRIFSKRLTENCITVHEEEPPLILKGFMGTRELVRRKSGEQYLYVNGRLVTDRMMNSAVYAAYGGHLDKGEFPFFVLYLSLPPAEVDVNVHPAKTEVKFRNEWQIYQFIRQSCELAIREWTGDSSGISPSGGLNEQVFFSGKRPLPAAAPPRLEGEQLSFSGKDEKNKTLRRMEKSSFSANEFSLDDRIRRFEKSITEGTTDDAHLLLNERNFWQAHGKYIFTQISSGVVVIDQRAAHTRILYDRAIKALQQTSSSTSQQLLFPVTLELSPDDFSILLEMVPSLEKLGFSMREFGRFSILIEAVPADLQWLEEGKVVLQILDDYKNSRRLHNPVSEKIAMAYAQRAAVRRGEELTPTEMQRLTDELFQTENPYLSPTGKPVIIRLTLNELDRRFERN